MRSKILVLVQFLCIFAMVFTLNTNINFQTKILPITLIIFGVLVGIKAILDMKVSNLSIFPDVGKSAKLVTNGIYKFIRHPMYLSVLVVCLGFYIADITTIRTIIYFVLLADLIYKLHYEEKMLSKHFESYNIYQKQSKKLIPHIY